MKKIISVMLIMIMMVSIFSTYAFAVDTSNTVITVQDAQGFASQAVTVIVRIDEVSGASASTLKIKYDKKLELLYAENGGFFTNMSQSAIYGQDTSGVNGEYTYIGLNDGENSARIRGELVKLTFKLPSDAQVGDIYTVEVDKKQSLLATGIDSSLDYNVKAGSITVTESGACAGHTFGEEVVLGSAGILSNGYKYKICTVCKVAETEYVPATEINVYNYLGTSINYTGKPSGIAPMFSVNMDALNSIKEQNADCKIDAGIVVYKDGKLYDEEVFFGQGATYQLVENTLFVKVTNVSAYDEFIFKAYVKITNEGTGEERIAYTVATVRDSEEISICDVVKCLDLKSYSKENRVYLQNILDGFAD